LSAAAVGVGEQGLRLQMVPPGAGMRLLRPEGNCCEWLATLCWSAAVVAGREQEFRDLMVLTGLASGFRR